MQTAICATTGPLRKCDWLKVLAESRPFVFESRVNSGFDTALQRRRETAPIPQLPQVAT